MNKTCECGHTFEYKQSDIKPMHRVLCGDSTQPEAVLRLMDGKKADMVLTDPPYNVNYEGGTGLKIENDNMGDTAFLSFLTEANCKQFKTRRYCPRYISRLWLYSHSFRENR